jgi:hypothetical protein
MVTWIYACEGGTSMETQGNWTRTARGLWLWPVAILVGFPIGGYVADLARVDAA